jgi:CDP-glucose 4,6-dehydratase
VKTADSAFWRGRRVLVTGHTGFKGAWLALRLSALGAEVTGLALDPATDPSLFTLADVGATLRDRRGDIRDAAGVSAAITASQPRIVFHLAAQALVRTGLEQPLETLETNVVGAARVLDALRNAKPDAVVVVTSDKVYLNDGGARAFAEDDPLGGADPYSGSKAAAEMVARIWRESYGLPVVSARAGNVVGGGDFSPDRLVPDAWRALTTGKPLVLRNPASTRPWTHVLDAVEGYLLYAEAVAAGRPDLPPALNFGPARDARSVTAGEAADAFAQAIGKPLDWRQDPAPYPEKPTLAIDSTLARATLGWGERFPGRDGVAEAARWYGEWGRGADPAALSACAVRAYAEAVSA